MNRVQVLLLAALAVTAVLFLVLWIRSAARHPQRRWPRWSEFGIGVVTDFFDALGIGFFSTTTSVFRLFRLVPDELIPGTLNVGHGPAAIAEALIFVAAVTVDPWLLAAMTGAAARGGWVGAEIVSRLSRTAIQGAKGAALLVAGALFSAVNLDLLPGGGMAMALSGWHFATAVGVNFVLGGLMAAGIGIFGPCMITLAFLGMHSIAAFPIMMTASRGRRAGRRIHRQVAAGRHAALARGGRRRVHGAHAAAYGRAPQKNSRRLRVAPGAGAPAVLDYRDCRQGPGRRPARLRRQGMRSASGLNWPLLTVSESPFVNAQPSPAPISAMPRGGTESSKDFLSPVEGRCASTVTGSVTADWFSTCATKPWPGGPARKSSSAGSFASLAVRSWLCSEATCAVSRPTWRRAIAALPCASLASMCAAASAPSCSPTRW